MLTYTFTYSPNIQNLDLSFSPFSLMDLPNTMMNILVPILTLIILLFILPLYLLYNFIISIFTFNSHENVAGKVVVITGASSGIGERLAYEYAKRGAYLVLGARRHNSLQQVAETALQLGSPDVIALRTDVSKLEDCSRLIDEAINHFGRLDHLVNNAGISTVSSFEDVADVTTYAQLMDINYWGSVYTTHFAIPHLRKSKGKIIGIASCCGSIHLPRLSFYNASKAAIISFYETLRIELGTDIGITVVNPGFVESEITQGKFLSKDGKLKLDQELRDVALNLFPVISAEDSARAIANSACRGDKCLIHPFWCRSAIFFVTFWPEAFDWFMRAMLMTPHGVPPEEALGKKLLDATGLKKFLYPDSILSLKLKT